MRHQSRFCFDFSSLDLDLLSFSLEARCLSHFMFIHIPSHVNLVAMLTARYVTCSDRTLAVSGGCCAKQSSMRAVECATVGLSTEHFARAKSGAFISARLSSLFSFPDRIARLQDPEDGEHFPIPSRITLTVNMVLAVIGPSTFSYLTHTRLSQDDTSGSWILVPCGLHSLLALCSCSCSRPACQKLQHS